MAEHSPRDLVRHAFTWSIIWGILLIVFGAGSMIWKLLVGLAYLLFGVYLLTHSALAVASLTLALASLFLIEGKNRCQGNGVLGDVLPVLLHPEAA